MITTTLNEIKCYNPGPAILRRLVVRLNLTNDEQEFPLSAVLDSNGMHDAIWCLRVCPDIAATFAAWCAKRAADTADAYVAAARYYAAAAAAARYSAVAYVAADARYAAVAAADAAVAAAAVAAARYSAAATYSKERKVQAEKLRELIS